MTEKDILPLLKSKPKRIVFCNKQLVAVSPALCRFAFTTELNLQSNRLSDLPLELAQMTSLTIINLGNNEFTDIPEVLSLVKPLQKLLLFNNLISQLSAERLGSLRRLQVLNLNNNQLVTLPREIGKLQQLKSLFLDRNNLTKLPVEMCAIPRLQEIHAIHNDLSVLPAEFGCLMNLERLYLSSNRLTELPDTFCELFQLRVLDIAGNRLRIFPPDFDTLPLQEFYAEQNPLLQPLMVQSVQENEVLTLKELCARFVMRELKNRYSVIRFNIKYHPDVREMLSRCGFCPVDGQAFLDTWLECVKFVDARLIFRATLTATVIPVRSQLCSYKCFNNSGNMYYGIVYPEQ